MRLFQMVVQKLKGLQALAVVTLIIFLFHFNPTTPHVLGQKRIKFDHFTIEHGLPQNTVFCILQDSRGFLWVGTENGLSRYDGYSFKPYQYNPEDPFSLSQNKVFSIFEDRSETLWIGTDGGLNRFDRLYERFSRYTHDSENPDKTLSNNTVRAIFEDRNDVLWIGSNGGLNKFNPKNQAFTCYKPDPQEWSEASPPTKSDHCKITSILEDSNDELWVGTCDGLYTFDRQKEEFKRWVIHTANSNKTCSNHISTIYEDVSKVLWFGTKDGRLLQFNRETQRFTLIKYNSQIPSCQGEFQIRSIFEEKTRRSFWIGTYGAGIYELDRQKKLKIHYREQPNISTSLSSNHIFTIYKDRGGIIWIGTEDGLNKLYKRKNEFLGWTTEPFNENSLSDNNVWSIYKDKSGILWIGTDKGLNRFDRKNGIFTHYTNDPQKTDTLSQNRVLTICEDYQGVLWLGTQGGGLNKFDKKTEIFTRYIPPPGYEPPPGKSKNLYHVSHSRINVIIEDHQGVLWLGTDDGGLNKFDRETETFNHYMPDQNNPTRSLSHGYVSSILEDKTGILWVGTANGLNEFNRETETFKHYKKDINNEKSLSNDYVSAIYEDRFGTLWIGTYFGGLNKLEDREKGIFKHYRKKDGLCNDTIYGILEDEVGNLWLSTVNGLSKFNPQTGEFKNYDVRDGLQSNEFNGGAWFKADDGEMFFGGMNGFNSFYPHSIKDNQHQPPIVITNFSVFNKPYPGPSIIEEKNVTLSYSDSVFSIEFAALDFSIPGKNIYEYKMKGVDPDWVRGDAKKRFVTYTKLGHGEYEFRVRGTNNDGIWSNKEAVLKITITPPFWQTWWFQALLVILFVFIILTIYRMRTKRLRNKLAEQQRIQEILKQSHDEMERAKDLAELRHAENEKLLTAISAIFIAVDSKGIIFQWNTPAEDFFGMGSDETTQKPFLQVLKHCISENKLNDIIEIGLKKNKSSKPIDFIDVSVDLKARGKGIRLLATSISPIRDSAGRSLGFLLLAEDITNRKEEELLENHSRRLESLGQMASGIAHEIKTPLQFIGDNADFVSDSFNKIVKFYEMIHKTVQELKHSGRKDTAAKIKKLIAEHDMRYIIEEIPKASEQITNGVNRVSDIIQSMNEFTHPGKGTKDRADINQLLKSTLVMVQSKIKKNADIKLELCEALPRIPCYAGELNQVFMNILVNALDAIIDTGKWGLITISTAVEGNEVFIAISDTGCGIPEENQDHIFDTFFTTKEVGKGTGQGLSLARNVIIEKHKGKLDFTSKEGKGTIFYIRLPIKGE